MAEQEKPQQETPLSAIIRQKIKDEGPMDMGTYMSLCLGHPEHGYYMHQDPFGAGGDFTTAPEISQIFGELIGAWIADTWMQMGQPNPFNLVEVGGGRGTLMADALRATKSVAGFHEAMQVVMVEISPHLKSKQQEALSAYDAKWVTSIHDVADDSPLIVVGNEFLDALSTRQLEFIDTEWREICVGLSDNDTYRICHETAEKSLLVNIPPMLIAPQQGDIVEVSVDRKVFIDELCKKLIKQSGSALFIDYGFTQNVFGNTLQAVKNHEYCDIFDTPGKVDLTSHVNFSEISDWVMQNKLMVHDAIGQGEFMKRLGAEVRGQKLVQNASAQQAQEIQSALQRLTGTNTKAGEMGALFKVIAFSSDASINLAGF